MEEILTIEELGNKYPDEWICIEVIKEGEDSQPTAGRLIAHGAEKKEVIQAASRFRRQNPQARGYVFFTGELIPKGTVVILCQTPEE